MKTPNSFRATRHAPTAQCHVMQNTLNSRRWVLRSWGKGTAERADSSFRPQTVPMNQRSFKASRRVRTTLIDHVTLGMKGVLRACSIASLEPPSWNAKHGLSRWRRKPCHTVPQPLSHRNTFPTLNTFTPCTLERLDAGSVCEGGVPLHGCETSIPQPLKYILFSFVPFVLVGSEVVHESF